MKYSIYSDISIDKNGTNQVGYCYAVSVTGVKLPQWFKGIYPDDGYKNKGPIAYELKCAAQALSSTPEGATVDLYSDLDDIRPILASKPRGEATLNGWPDLIVGLMKARNVEIRHVDKKNWIYRKCHLLSRQAAKGFE